MCNENCDDKDKNDEKPSYSSSSSVRSAKTMALKREWSLADETVYANKKQPSRVAKKMVSYCDKSDSELEFDEDGYEQSKTKSFNKKANATDSDSDEFKLGPNADDEDKSIAYDTVLSELESQDEEMMGLKRKKNSNVVSLTHTVGTGVRE